MSTHSAAWIKSKHASLEVGPAETPTPGPTDLLVRVQVIAFSPIESKLQTIEVHPLSYPNILGLSFAGIVEAVGSDVNDFSKGDRIATVRPDDTLKDARFGAFQQYALASRGSTSKLAATTTLESGAAAILNLATVTAAFVVYLGLDRPDLSKGLPTPSNGKKVLVYGGSSSSGSLAISFARAAGYEVVTTSSPRNRDFVSSLHPTIVIDHSQAPEDTIADLRTHGPYHRILDTIGTPPVTNIIVDYLSGIGGGEYNTLIPVVPGTGPIPDNVQRKFESYGWVFTKPEYSELREWFYHTMLPQGLESGVIAPLRLKWISGGIGQAQHALDLMDRGEVSGCKLVMNPWE